MTATAEPRLLAVARSLDDVREAVRLRCVQLGITRNELDERAGLTDGHAGKLLSPRGVKHLGRVSLGRVMAATDLVLIVAVDGEPVEQIEQAIAARQNACDMLANGKAPRWRSGKGSTWGRRLAARRALKLTAEQRSEIARKAAKARWQRRRSTAPVE